MKIHIHTRTFHQEQKEKNKTNDSKKRKKFQVIQIFITLAYTRTIFTVSSTFWLSLTSTTTSATLYNFQSTDVKEENDIRNKRGDRQKRNKTVDGIEAIRMRDKIYVNCWHSHQIVIFIYKNVRWMDRWVKVKI